MSEPPVRLEAYASGSGTIYMAAGDQYVAARDLHVHYGDGVHRVRRVEAGSDSSDECPYPGMTAFGAEQAQWFFGREQTLTRLTSRLDQCLQEGGAVAVVAASGAGKSSLLQAGLVPALARGTLPGSRHWPCLVFTPGAHPVIALSRHLAALTGGEPAEIERELADDPQALGDRLRAALDRQRAGRLVVIVDQAEELFTQVADEEQRRRLVAALEHLTAQPANAADGPPALVVYGVRADFYARFAQYDPLRTALEHRQVFLGPLSRTELREAILFPAQREGLAFEEGLVELLLSDLGVTGVTAHGPSRSHDPDSDDPDADGKGDRGSGGSTPERGYEAGRLPLLAHALRVTWQQRHGSVLTVDGYRASGRIQGAVAETAEDVYRRLAADGRQATTVIFRRLVRVGDGSDDTRRARTERELTEGLDPTAAEAVLAGFTRRRLLTRLRDTVQITHEALLDAWPRLRRWIDADRADNLLRQKLEEAAAAWALPVRRDPDLLYRGSQLEVARAWAKRTGQQGLGPTATAFLDASIRRSRRSTTVRRGAIALLLALTLTALALTDAAISQQQLADQQRTAANRQRNLANEELLQAQADLLRTSDPQLSLQLSLTALLLRPTQEGRTGLITTLLQTPLDGGSAPGAVGQSPFDTVFSPDGSMLADTSGTKYSTVRLWDTTDVRQPRPLATLTDHVNPIRELVFGPDQRLLVSVAGPGGESPGSKPAANDVILWDLSDRHHPRKLAFQADVGAGMQGAAISPDGRRLALLSGDGATGTLTLWDISDVTAPRRLGTPVSADQAQFATFSADGRTLVTSSGTITAKDESLTPGSITHRTGWQVWDLSDPTRPRAVAEQPLIGGAAVFSPTGPILATSYQRSAFLWDLSNPSAPRQLAVLNNSDQVQAIAFGPHGLLITTALDGSSRLWDVTDPAHPQARSVLTGSHGASPSVPKSDDLPTTPASFPAIDAAGFGPDGQRVFLADGDGAVSQWLVDNRSAPAQVATLSGHNLDEAAFSPNGKLLAAGGFTGDTHLWDTSDPTHPRELPPLPGQPGRRVTAAAFNRTGAVLAVGTATGVNGEEGQVTLWDVTDPGRARVLATLPMASGVGSLAFSPRSELLAVSGGKFFEASWSALWDTTVPAAATELATSKSLGSTTIIHQPTAFSPDGRWLALPNSLWDVSKPSAPVPAPVAKSDGSTDSWSGTTAAAFRPDAKVLAATDLKGFELWQLGASSGPQPLSSVSLPSDVIQLSYHPDGKLIAVGQRNGVVALYEAGDPAHPGLAATLPDTASDVSDVQLGPDGRTLVVVRADGSAQLWDLGALPAIADDPIGMACRIAGGGLSAVNWKVTYQLTQPYQDTCPGS
ncbi:hypothetical protein [Kitasatospora sp. LaBMicrA B282]|uniref:WD40 repeat domain-containing protein n=1 Tax=Kitasatospora sp. LaBMicrA B282 TaxID=3420949 RepID=UPI003D09BD8B